MKGPTTQLQYKKSLAYDTAKLTAAMAAVSWQRTTAGATAVAVDAPLLLAVVLRQLCGAGAVVAVPLLLAVVLRHRNAAGAAFDAPQLLVAVSWLHSLVRRHCGTVVRRHCGTVVRRHCGTVVRRHCGTVV
jgi:hypothetical protein